MMHKQITWLQKLLIAAIVTAVGFFFYDRVNRFVERILAENTRQL